MEYDKEEKEKLPDTQKQDNTKDKTKKKLSRKEKKAIEEQSKRSAKITCGEKKKSSAT